MITTRARGLVNLHAGISTLAVGVFFWTYAEVIMRYVPIVKLSREVNLLPYFLCVVGGMLLATRDQARLAAQFHLRDAGGATRLAMWQVGLMALLIFAMMFATLDRSISRLFLGTFLVWSWLGLSVLNAHGPRLLARLVFQGGHRLPTLFVGRTESFGRLDEWIAHKEALGIQPVGMLTDAGPGSVNPPPAPWLGRTADLATVLAERQIGQVIVLELPESNEAARSLIEICREHGCRLLIHNNLEERYTQPLVPIIEEGRHFYTLQAEPLEDPFNRLLKRALDLGVALPVVVFILPPLCVWIALMQRRQAPGPLFHARERRGLQGQTFRMWKFRSMRVEPADARAEARQASADDARIFPFGRFLRRRSLDEFPQFWNVLRGEMSLVGPRPYMPELDETFRQRTRGYRSRQLVKPGITGLAQSRGYRGEILEQEMLLRRVHWDVHYITHWSVWLDLQITARTLWQVFRPPPTAY